MSRFYTSCVIRRGTIYLRGYSDGKRIQERIKCEPYVFVSDQNGTYKTLKGQSVKRVDFDSVPDCRSFLESHAGTHGLDIYGSTHYAYVFLNDHYPGTVAYDPDLVSVVSLDIECAPADGEPEGFPDITTADQPITLITMRKRGESITFGCEYYRSKDPKAHYVLCKDERELLLNFLLAWNHKEWAPDVVTGWNIDVFDIPYIVNRITRVLGQESAKRLSPWHILEEREVEIKGTKTQTFSPVGVNILDYMRLYKKFTYSNHESYALDYIASDELGVKKLDYSEYGSLNELRKKNWSLYVDYNIRDTVLVEMLEDKKGFIRLVFAMAYNAKVNYIDTLGTVRQWDCLIHNHLMDNGVVVPLHEVHKHDQALMGGYVKEPVPAMYEWVVGLDIASSYPHQIMGYNISPETFVARLDNFPSLEDILDGAMIGVELGDYACTANGCLYRRDVQGVFPALMQKMYDDRKVYKKKMLDAQKEFEKTGDPDAKKRAVLYDTFQHAAKVTLNSGYGSMSNIYFRWFSFDNAEAITTSGQIAVRWIEKRINQYMNKMMKTKMDYVIASDTDSIYLNMGPLAEKIDASRDDMVGIVDRFCKDKIEPYIAKCYDELAKMMNAREQKMIMKREIIADKGIWRGKKMYILNVLDSEGVRYAEPKLKIKGIETVRSSTPYVCRERLKDTIKVIMNGDEEVVKRFIDQFHSEFAEMPFEQVAFPRGVKLGYYKTMPNGGIAKFQYNLQDKSLPIQVRAALVYNRELTSRGLDNRYPLIVDNDKCRFAYMKMPNPFRSDVIACPREMPPEFKADLYIDRETQFEKAYLAPIKSILDVIGWKIDKKASLEGFFA